jgi:hypothetical protein
VEKPSGGVALKKVISGERINGQFFLRGAENLHPLFIERGFSLFQLYVPVLRVTPTVLTSLELWLPQLLYPLQYPIGVTSMEVSNGGVRSGGHDIFPSLPKGGFSFKAKRRGGF